MNDDVCTAIIDIGLPDRRGDALVAEVRAINPSLPIVIASGYVEEALREGFSHRVSW
jgi:DNA-binding NarL/FixJ family response regulator